MWCSKEKHQQIHAQISSGCHSEEAKEIKSQKMTLYHQNRDEKYEERNKKIAEATKGQMRHGEEAHVRYITQQEEKEKEINRKKERIKEIFNLNYDDLTWGEKISYSKKISFIENPKLSERQRQYVTEWHKQGKYGNAKTALKEATNKNKFLKELFPAIDKEEFFHLFGLSYDDLPSSNKGVYSYRYRNYLYELKNHKVVKVQLLNEKADVYDIQVEHNHNFALDCGVFVHNSKDAADAVCGATFTASKYAEQYAYDYGEALDEIIEINKDEFSPERVNMDFEAELKKMGPLLGGRNPGIKQEDDYDYDDYGDDSTDVTTIEDGCLIW